MDLDASHAAMALGQVLATVAILAARIARLEKKFDTFAALHAHARDDIERRVITLEGRRATR